MRRFWYRLAGAVVPVLVIAQLALPSFLGDRVESRLTEDGGRADVSLGAIPALRLLVGDGDTLNVRASGIRLDTDRRERPFDALDKFGDVTVFIERSRAGAFKIQSFFLDRTGDERYRVLGSFTTNPAAIAGEVGGQFGALVAGVTFGTDEIPAQLRATVDTSGDEPRTLDATASVAGLPAGPLALAFLDAVLAGL